MEFLPSPMAWHSKYSFTKEPSLLEVNNLLFSKPCVQIDFEMSISYEKIKSILLAICVDKGEVLHYDDCAFLKLPNYTHPVEWHFDGISSVRKERVPDWIFFLHSGTPHTSPNRIKNGFSIANCCLLYEHLCDESKFLLGKTSQTILNHKVGTADSSEKIFSDLNVQCHEIIGDSLKVFRGHIPFHDTVEQRPNNSLFYCYPDNLKFQFKNLKWNQQVDLLSDLQKVLEKSYISYHHTFEAHSLLAIHNKSCFHSLPKINPNEKMICERIQIIETNIIKKLLPISY